ncbi:MAG TPA: N-acetylmuramoyl-L-alanine amidase [Candidatus Ozemobacteraceae bacterium]|nr:N-acetylmuramoyl-L-alanine amidase [Candidatus Ozemobacteraceae bacterium]
MISNRFRRSWRHTLAAGAAVVLFMAGPSFAQENERSKGYINAREFAESQGIAYQWFPMQKTLVLTRGGRTMRLTVGKTDALVNEQPFALPSPPVLENGQVIVPARSIINAFASQQASQKPLLTKPPQVKIESPEETTEEEESDELGPDTPADETPALQPAQQRPAAPPPPVVLTTAPAEEPTVEEEKVSTLVTVRHSVREDHTRVVLEFDGPMQFTTENLGKGKLKLRINGCRNIIPTKRSNPAGRDLKSVTFHAGPDRKGLVVNFDAVSGESPPVIETVANPYRIVLSFKAPPDILASASQKLAAASETTEVPPKPASAAAAIPASASGQVAAAPSLPPEPVKAEKPGTTEPAQAEPPAREPAKNVKIDVPLETLTRTVFTGRAIVIDPGHGGSDMGVTANGLSPEKEITLSIAAKLRQTLRQMGFNAYLLRSQDTTMSPADRLAAANKAGGDLVISLHVGGSSDETIEGAACFSYDSAGITFEGESGGKISPHTVYGDWAKSTRFDLARFLSGKIRDRLVQHLSARDRGVRPLPLLPLRFMVYPAVLVEVGMLSNPTEGPKLSTSAYQEAAARSIANGIVDFFNSIKLNP